MVATLESRFLAKVNKTDSCWLWTGATLKRGYGTILGSEGRVEGAHVIAYKIYVGPVPPGYMVDHRCRVKNCVNPSPEHLRLATVKQNAENLGVRHGSQSGVRGVTWDKANNKWRATVGHNGKTLQFGRFDTVEEAERVVVAKRNELFTHNDKDRQQNWSQ